MAFIKEESEDVKIEETFRVKHEETETQTGQFHSQVFLYSVLCIYLSIFIHATPSELKTLKIVYF